MRKTTLLFCFCALWTLALAHAATPRILFFGDSLSAGYGIGKELAFPALVQEKIDAAGLSYQVVNAGVSGDTSAGGLRRIDWMLRQGVDVLVLELGANDGLRGLPLETTEENLQAIIDLTRRRNPAVRLVIAGMKLPPNLGREYTLRFEALFTRLAEKNQAVLIPFLLEGVAGRPNLNLEDGIHPTPEGHRLVAATVWRYLAPLLAGQGAAGKAVP